MTAKELEQKIEELQQRKIAELRSIKRQQWYLARLRGAFAWLIEDDKDTDSWEDLEEDCLSFSSLLRALKAEDSEEYNDLIKDIKDFSYAILEGHASDEELDIFFNFGEDE